MDTSTKKALTVLVLTTHGLLLFPSHGETLCFEAEMANRIDPMMEIVADAACSGGHAIAIRQGAGNEQVGRTSNGRALYAFTVSQTGKFSVWVRARWLDACSDSIHVIVPGASWGTAMDCIYGRWHWVRTSRYKMQAGTNVLILANREDGVAVDQVVVSNVPGFKPKGVLSPTIVPGTVPLPDEIARVEASISLRGGEFPPRPARHADLSHRVEGPGQLPDFHPVCPALPGVSGRLTLWVRNNATTAAQIRLRLRAAPELGFSPTRQAPATLPPRSLTPMEFDFCPKPELTMAEHVVAVEYESDGMVLRKRARLVRPFAWEMVGPFHHASGRLIDFPHPPERDKNARDYSSKTGRIEWKPVDLRAVCTPFAFLDVGRLYGRPNWACAYARTRFDLDADGDVLLLAMGDDAIRVWVDGRSALTADACLPAMLNRAVTRIHLSRGRHELFVKTCQAMNYWEFFVELRPAPGERCHIEGVHPTDSR